MDQVKHEIFPASLIVNSIRDSGYRNAAYALAELVDNATQAGASDVQILCFQVEELVTQRRRRRLNRIAVVDNGAGMCASTLRMALQFGNGTYLNDRSGIGRFGMGLPNSSLSQAKRVEVWTWTSGSSSSLYSYLDVDEIAAGTTREVPEPEPRKLPRECVAALDGKLGESGTIVLWSHLDRCQWKTGNAIVTNSEHVIGRIYRRLICDGRLRIRLGVFDRDGTNARVERDALPNDPMYLMERSSTPGEWSTNPMFEPWGDSPDQTLRISYGGQTHDVTVRFSAARPEARQGHNPGEKRHGKHAARNLGVSIMRADRELELDARWLPGYDPVARWIGIEVDFPPALDEVFGVTNNKQSATHLADLASKEELLERHDCRTYQELKELWVSQADPRAALLDVGDAIQRGISALMKLLKAQTRGTRGARRRFDKNSPEAKATEATNKRKEDGHRGESDESEGRPAGERLSEIARGMEDEGVQPDVAKGLAAQTVDEGLKYVFAHAASAGGAFFNVKPRGGSIIITLNTQHPAYKHLVEVLEDGLEGDATVEELQARHARALVGLKLLLSAWARYEDEQPDGVKKHQAQDAREDWGRVARQFLIS